MIRMKMRDMVAGVAAMAMTGAAAPVAARVATTTSATPTAPATPAPVKTPATQPIPPFPVQGMLIQYALAALNQANQAADYSVLLKNASRSFQRVNSAAQLAEQFKVFREARIDLSSTVLFVPRLTAPPVMSANILHLKGFIPSQPQRATFDLYFEREDGRFRIAGISVGVVPAGTPARPAPQQK